MNPIKMAILGCGGMSGGHARRYREMPEVQIVALCDVKEEIVERYIEKNLPDYEPKPQIFTDYDAMLAEVKPDAITIVTPHTMHFEHGMKAVEAGCHVLMEKPMVTEAGQAHELAAAVEKSGKIFIIGYNSPSTPAMQWLRNAIRDERFGKLQTISGWQAQGWRNGTIGSWRQNPALSGGGMMYDSGAHVLNALVWSVESPVDTVFAFTDNVETPVDINGTINVRFQNGVLATMSICGNAQSGGCCMTYVFERARVDVDGWSGSTIKLFEKWSQEAEIELEGEAENTTEHFVRSVLGQSPPATAPINGIIQSELMDAIYESARTGQAAQPVRRS